MSATRAIARWTRLLGRKHVVPGGTGMDSKVAQAERATFKTAQRVVAILRPKDADEVSACLKIANATNVPVYPTSGGRNWGYGSRVPAHDAALLDLGRMNRICEHDEQLAYVVVEPGVTFAALEQHLRKRRSNLAPLSVGSSLSASVVANVLERGFGRGGYPDRFANACALEVVLPTGARHRTGFSERDDAPAAFVHRHGVGPSLDGLFSQSNLGIVTKMAVWLRPKYPLEDGIQFSVERRTDFIKVVDALQELRLRGILRDSCAISTRQRVLAVVQQYPWGDARGRTPLPASVLRRVRAAGIARWMGWATTGYQNEAHRDVERKLIAKALEGRADSLRFTPISSSEAQRAELSLPYWRKRVRRPEHPDPDRDGCGVILVGPVVPFTGKDIANVSATMEKVLIAHGFDPILQVQCLFERAVIINGMILFDRDVPGEDEAAIACYQALRATLEAAGYRFYRESLLGMGRSKKNDLRRTLKRVLDPNDVLAPGRYIARERS